MPDPEISLADNPGSGAPNSRLDDRIYQALLGRIHSGTYGLGERLPPENDLADEFDVSRPVIRAALARLREAGLVVSRKGSGSFVSSGDSHTSGGFTALSSIEDIAGYFAFRRTIEAEAASLAATRPDKALIAQMHAALSGMDDEIEAGLATVEHDMRFHSLVARMSGNRYLYESLQLLRPHMIFMGRFVRSLSPSGYVRGKMSMRDEHHRIVAAIEAADPAAARARMEDHIRASELRIFEGE